MDRGEKIGGRRKKNLMEIGGRIGGKRSKEGRKKRRDKMKHEGYEGRKGSVRKVERGDVRKGSG